MGGCAGKKEQALYIKTNTVITDAPKVKYRGIFINDEAPAFPDGPKKNSVALIISFMKKCLN